MTPAVCETCGVELSFKELFQPGTGGHRLCFMCGRKYREELDVKIRRRDGNVDDEVFR